jgi:hypothetical protein
MKWPRNSIIRRAYEFNKIVVLPAFDTAKSKMKLMKVDNPNKDLVRPAGNSRTEPGQMQAGSTGFN